MRVVAIPTNVSLTPIVLQAQAVKMHAVAARVNARMSAVVMPPVWRNHTMPFALVHPIHVVIHPLNVSTSSAQRTRTVPMRKPAWTPNVLIPALCQMFVALMRVALPRTISVFVPVKVALRVMHNSAVSRYNTVTQTVSVLQAQYVPTASVLRSVVRCVIASRINCAYKAFVSPHAGRTLHAPNSNIVTTAFAPRRYFVATTTTVM